MREGPAARPGAAAQTRAIRHLLVAYLVCTLIARMVDAYPHPDGWYLVWVAASFVLPAWFLSGRFPEPWLRVPGLLLAAQAVACSVPFALFGSHWVAGVDGLLGALILLVVRSPARWVLLACAVAAEVAAWVAVGPTLGYWTNLVWVPLAYLNTALGVYGIATARTLLERLESTSEVLADAAVDEQRFATARRLQDSILRLLDGIRQRAARASDVLGAASRPHLEGMGAAAREAAAEARLLASTLPDAAPPAVDSSPASPRVADNVVRAVTVIFALIFVENTLVVNWIYTPATLGTGAVPIVIGAADIAIAITMVALQLRHLRPRNGQRPRLWGATLTAQIVLCGALYPVFGPTSMLFLPFVGSSALVLLRGPLRWVLAAAAILALPVLTLIRQDGISSYEAALLWVGYAVPTSIAAVLVFVGLGRFADAAAGLAAALRLIARSAATRERVRIARDTHDTLGLTLSTIALKSDLALALLEREPERAHREVLQAMHLAHTAASDAASIVTGTLALDLTSELSAARDALAAGGIAVEVVEQADRVEGELGTQLAAVLREAVANVLRHSDARTCTIRIGHDGATYSLEVVNDGARPAGSSPGGGHGLRNIRARLAALDGDVDSDVRDGVFTLRIRLPDPAVREERRDPAAAR
jgi:two-component system, NarL family, sensor histidine kinase DesK